MKSPNRPAPRPYPKTQRQVSEIYQGLGFTLGKAGIEADPSERTPSRRIDHEPKPCTTCGRLILYATRWNGNLAKLNAQPLRGENPGQIEISPGVFIPAFHHQCPGKPPTEKPWAPRPKRKDQRRPSSKTAQAKIDPAGKRQGRKNRKPRRNPDQGELL